MQENIIQILYVYIYNILKRQKIDTIDLKILFILSLCCTDEKNVQMYVESLIADEHAVLTCITQLVTP